MSHPDWSTTEGVGLSKCLFLVDMRDSMRRYHISCLVGSHPMDKDPIRDGRVGRLGSFGLQDSSLGLDCPSVFGRFVILHNRPVLGFARHDPFNV